MNSTQSVAVQKGVNQPNINPRKHFGVRPFPNQHLSKSTENMLPHLPQLLTRERMKIKTSLYSYPDYDSLHSTCSAQTTQSRCSSNQSVLHLTCTGYRLLCGVLPSDVLSSPGGSNSRYQSARTVDCRPFGS